MLYLIVAACFAFALATPEHQEAFTNWMIVNKRSYGHDEFQSRYQTFQKNYDFVKNFQGEHEVGLNEFADLSSEEFGRMYNGLKYVHTPKESFGEVQLRADAPSEVDWRKKGAVTPIKNQGQCGSCWSFSTTGSVEGIYEITFNNLKSFSEQNLVDCSTSQGNMGCNGGLMDQAFQYIISNQGLDTESSYPYTATGPNQCQYKASNSGGYITSYKDVISGSESDLTNHIVSQPVSVAIDASHSSFQFYTSGVYYEPDCSSTQLDHGVLAVGYGASGSKDYYIVKNSWGVSWGNQGYIWMSRNRNNNCGIATSASVPLGAKQP